MQPHSLHVSLLALVSYLLLVFAFPPHLAALVPIWQGVHGNSGDAINHIAVPGLGIPDPW